MPAWVWPVASAAASLVGGLSANRANARQAQKQMDFQERMSSTAAERSVQDFVRAGLNPALAYDRQASSPGGASAVMGDPLGSAAASARAAVMERKQRELMDAQTLSATETAKKAAADAAVARVVGANEQMRGDSLRAQAMVDKATIDARIRGIEAQSKLTGLELPAAENQAKFEEFIGAPGAGGMRILPLLLNLMRGLRGPK